MTVLGKDTVDIETAKEMIGELEQAGVMRREEFQYQYVMSPSARSGVPYNTFFVQYRNARFLICNRANPIPEHRDRAYHDPNKLVEYSHTEVTCYHPERKGVGTTGVCADDRIYTVAALKQTMDDLYNKVVEMCIHQNHEKEDGDSYRMLHTYRCKDCGARWTLDSSD